MATAELDGTRTDAFAARMVQIANDAFLGLTIGVGSRTGLYEVLARVGAATSEELAAAADLSERHVREWLAAQVTGGILEYDADSRTYALPPEHAALLTPAAGPNDLANLMTAIAPFAGLEPSVVEGLRTGSGIPVDRMADVQEFQGRLTRPVHDATLLARVLPAVPGLVDRLRAGADVLDVGCGEGHAASLVADAFPLARVAGYDFSERNVAAARAEAERLALRNVRFERRDAADLERDAYDVVLALDVVHDLARPYETLRAIHGALRPGGVLLQSEHALSSRLDENLEHPLAPLLYAVSLFHCMSLSLAEEGAAALGIAWGEPEVRAALAAAGFAEVGTFTVDGDPFNRYYAAVRG